MVYRIVAVRRSALRGLEPAGSVTRPNCGWPSERQRPSKAPAPGWKICCV